MAQGVAEGVTAILMGVVGVVGVVGLAGLVGLLGLTATSAQAAGPAPHRALLLPSDTAHARNGIARRTELDGRLWQRLIGEHYRKPTQLNLSVDELACRDAACLAGLARSKKADIVVRGSIVETGSTAPSVRLGISVYRADGGGYLKQHSASCDGCGIEAADGALERLLGLALADATPDAPMLAGAPGGDGTRDFATGAPGTAGSGGSSGSSGTSGTGASSSPRAFEPEVVPFDAAPASPVSTGVRVGEVALGVVGAAGLTAMALGVKFLVDNGQAPCALTPPIRQCDMQVQTVGMGAGFLAGGAVLAVASAIGIWAVETKVVHKPSGAITVVPTVLPGGAGVVLGGVLW